MRAEAVRNPDSRLTDRIAGLTELVPERPRDPGPGYVGFAVPLRLRAAATGPPETGAGPGEELRLLSTLTRFGTAADVTVAELRLEAFLPADARTAELLAAASPARE